MKAVETAIRMEEDAIGFYTDAAGKTAHPFGKRMFQSFVLDEKRHLEMLREILRGLDIDIRQGDPVEAVKTIFETLKAEMMERVGAEADELAALKTALDMEKEGHEFYRRAAAEAGDEKERALFQRLAFEEKRHHDILLNTHAFLTDTGNWFMWDEFAIVDGGTPWA